MCTPDPSNSYPICTCPENQIILENSKSCGCPINAILTEDQYCENVPLCAINNGNCEQNCENSQNGSVCSCFEGYEAHNSTHCKDIDECIEENECMQECLNTLGSFECKCSEGYFMNDNNQCVDINECEISSPCQYNCTNLIGGFKCHCPEGFELSVDNFTCNRVMKTCEAPTVIDHGILSCNINEDSSQCEVSCDAGYILQGSALNICHNGEWNYDFAKCVRKFSFKGVGLRLNTYS